MGFFDFVSKAAAKSYSDFNKNVERQLNESDRKAAEYERRGNLSSKQRENLDKYYEKSAKARKIYINDFIFFIYSKPPALSWWLFYSKSKRPYVKKHIAF